MSLSKSFGLTNNNLSVFVNSMYFSCNSWIVLNEEQILASSGQLTFPIKITCLSENFVVSLPVISPVICVASELSITGMSSIAPSIINGAFNKEA